MYSVKMMGGMFMGSNLNDFYYDLLNIAKGNRNDVDVVKKVVSEEMKLVKNYTEDMEGLCKVVGTNIRHELVLKGITSRVINVQDYYGSNGKDHLFVIAFVKDQDSKYLLIDPTYCQFCGLKGDLLFPLTNYPDHYLEEENPNLLKQLMNDGMAIIDDYDYQIYLSSLVYSNEIDGNIHLDDVLLKNYDHKFR